MMVTSLQVSNVNFLLDHDDSLIIILNGRNEQNPVHLLRGTVPPSFNKINEALNALHGAHEAP